MLASGELRFHQFLFQGYGQARSLIEPAQVLAEVAALPEDPGKRVSAELERKFAETDIDDPCRRILVPTNRSDTLSPWNWLVVVSFTRSVRLPNPIR